MSATIIIPVLNHDGDFSSAFEEVEGKPMLVNAYERAKAASDADMVVVVSDDLACVEKCKGLGLEAIHFQVTGTTSLDSISEIVELLALEAQDIVVHLNWRELLASSDPIDQVIRDLSMHDTTKAAVLYTALPPEEVADERYVKIVFNSRGYVQYVSRSPLPYQRDGVDGQQHAHRLVGVKAFRAGLFTRLSEWDPCPYTAFEQVGLLELVWNGLRVHSTKIPADEARYIT